VSFALFVINAIQMIVIVDVLFSWFVKPEQFPRNITGQLTNPLYGPIRKLMGSTAAGGLDWAPLILLVSLNLIARLFTAPV